MYQYFENKKELFLFSVTWSVQYIMKNYSKYITVTDKNINIFDYFYNTSKELLAQLRHERELVIFIQDVFLGKYSSMTDESMALMMRSMDEYVLNMIRDGKKNGSIRMDIDDNILSLFLTGASIKIKEYILNKARDSGDDFIDQDIKTYEEDIKAMLELLKNGMGAK
jgi:AcrR family transcriptional regulator